MKLILPILFLQILGLLLCCFGGVNLYYSFDLLLAVSAVGASVSLLYYSLYLRKKDELSVLALILLNLYLLLIILLSMGTIYYFRQDPAYFALNPLGYDIIIRYLCFFILLVGLSYFCFIYFKYFRNKQVKLITVEELFPDKTYFGIPSFTFYVLVLSIIIGLFYRCYKSNVSFGTPIILVKLFDQYCQFW